MILFKCHAGCSFDAICAAAKIDPRELSKETAKQPGRVVAIYDYVNELGVLLFQVLRFDPKNFKQRKPDGGAGWIPNIKGVRRVPYNLPEVLRSNDVIVCEGEKDCETARTLGLVATCNPGGAGKWSDEYSEYLRGKSVIVIADADSPGRKHAVQVSKSLYLKSATIKIIEMPSGKKDLTEWTESMEKACSPEGLKRLIVALGEDAPEWRPDEQTKEGMPIDAEQIAPPFSEEALALRFSRKYGDLRYVDAWGKWLRWDGTRWRDDDTLQVFDLARLICREAAAECATTKPNVAPRLAAAATVAAVERLARADRRHTATVNQWDTDPWLLNTPTGTIELQSGEQREHREGDYLKKLTGTGLSSRGEACPLWLSFLDRVTDHSVELQKFLQRIVGYCLTGSISEHALFFLYGTGANGKSVFSSVIADVLGEYAKTAPISTFLATENEQHPTDLA